MTLDDLCCSSTARYTLATKLNSTRLTLLKADKVDRVALASLAPYTLASGDKVKRTFDIRATQSTLSTTSTEMVTMLTATSFRIQVVADLSPKPATKSTVSATVEFVAKPVSVTVDFVTSVYRS